MSPRVMSPSEQAARLAAVSLGRNQGPELFHQYNAPMTTGLANQTIIPRQVNLARALESVTVSWSGRIVIAGANYTAGLPEAGPSLIENIRIQGTHVRWGFQTPINLPGTTAFVWPRLFQNLGNDLIIGTTRSADPGMPYVQTAGLTQGLIGTYDVHLMVTIPVVPVLPPSPTSVRAQIPFLWRPQDWKNDLQVSITTGDQTSLGTPAGGTTVAWSSFGSAAGQPLVRVFLNYSLLGDFRNVPEGMGGLIVRSEQRIAAPLAAVGSQSQLGPELAHMITTNILVKAGINLTGQTAGVTQFSSLSDVQLDATKLVVDNKAIRDTAWNLASKNWTGRAFNTIQPQGYFLLSFLDSQNPMTALRGDTIPGGSRFAILTDVLTANANNMQTIVQEQAYGGPFAA